jgi:hypothetical protein
MTADTLEHTAFEDAAGTALTPLRLDDQIYGYRVKQAGNHYIDILRMIFNWRIVTTPVDEPMFIDRGWCYQGTGLAGFLPAALAAMAWDGSDETEPAGYFKRAGA